MLFIFPVYVFYFYIINYIVRISSKLIPNYLVTVLCFVIYYYFVYVSEKDGLVDDADVDSRFNFSW